MSNVRGLGLMSSPRKESPGKLLEVKISFEEEDDDDEPWIATSVTYPIMCEVGKSRNEALIRLHVKIVRYLASRGNYKVVLVEEKE
jgi:hypothetical protein